jgi:UDP-N-acetylmuramoyl-L-alanyl-D-glutamate--2,6-diaminopimelate ligase
VKALARDGLLLDTAGALPDLVSGITDDTRTLAPGGLFVAIRGFAHDGHDFLSRAESQGAIAAVVEEAGRTCLPAMIVLDGRRAAAIAAGAAYGDPGSEVSIAAVTGTNGKTTTVDILRHLLDEPSGSAASMGTLGVRLGSSGRAMAGGQGLTTPGPIELQRLLRALVDGGVRSVAMEVSSHSLDQHRVDGVRFDVAVFTNLTRDHLDYHGSMESYRAAKVRLVEYLSPEGVAVINADDRAWAELAAPRRVSYAIHSSSADVRAVDVAFTPRGSEWVLAAGGSEAPVRLPLIGSFNVANALGAAAAAWARGIGVPRIAQRLEALPQVPGRLEVLNEQPTVLRDYAHTPDALDRALDAVRPFTPRRLIVVFGCGGDRDRGKRPQMGQIAERKADIAIVTSDNPRTEDPERILDDIVAGMTGANHERIEDRRAAIARALDLADEEGDVVLLAGKGHETYQIRGTTLLPFDEREIVRDLLSNPS